MSNEENRAAVEAAAATEIAARSIRPKRDPGALRRAYERVTESPAGGAGKGVTQRTGTFVVPASLCEEGVFGDDFELTIRGLSAEQELRSAQAAKGDVVVMGFEMARRSLVAVNGTPIDAGRAEDDFLWEALGFGGRTLVVQVFMKMTGADADAAGKALLTLRMG